jgi:two-component system OmpR family response regulator
LATAPHVLIVDDQPEVCDLLMEELTRRGCIVTCAGSAAEMREALAADVFDLVLLDVVLPDEPGLPIIEDASQQPVPVILMSGYGAAAEQYGDGHLPFLGKPFRIEELLDIIEQKIGGRLPGAVKKTGSS